MVVASFQSAIQLVAGANIALFALPSLNQPALEQERKRWSSLIESATTNKAIADDLRDAQVGFWRIGQSIEREADIARKLALVFSVLYSALLLWMSWAADDKTDGIWLIVLSAVGGVPAAMLFKQNMDTQLRLAVTRDSRLRLERRVEDESRG